MSKEAESSELKTNRYADALAALMRIDAAVLLIAVIPALMPFAWMKQLHALMGMGELPDGPIVGYLTRSLSAVYAMHGVLVLFISLDVCRFLPLIKCLAILSLVFGLGMLMLDVIVKMPLEWTACEGPSIMALGAIMLWLAGRVPPGQPTDSAH